MVLLRKKYINISKNYSFCLFVTSGYWLSWAPGGRFKTKKYDNLIITNNTTTIKT